MALYGYLLELVALKEREPGDDLISRLITERVGTGEITRETAAMNGNILLIAGHETTSNMIGLSTLTLLRNPEAPARIRDTDDPGVLANAVEELLRYLTIAQDLIVRVALEDLTIGGQLVRAGDTLVTNLSAGNRDSTFLTDPDRFDIGRSARGPRLRLRRPPVPRAVTGTRGTRDRAARTPAGGTGRRTEVPPRDGHLRRPRTAGRLVATPSRRRRRSEQ
ncbi:cytochrome P450 [Streptomyces sp. NPDC059883]|uniref:cytochrome P450 n=1 Tax=unclassified Streptomyces TaxID=2593676 RepID=UPI00364EC68E